MRLIIALFLLISVSSWGQKWKSYIIGVRGDTLNRVDMKGLKQGPWVIHEDAVRGAAGFDEQGHFINDKKDGRWVRFSLIGDIIAEENYRWGALDGKCRYYTQIGDLEREESWRAVDPNAAGFDTVNVYDLIDPNKLIDRVVVPVIPGSSNKHGLWVYYDPRSGFIDSRVRYFMGKVKNDEEEGIDDGVIETSTSKPKKDTVGKKPLTKPQAILDYEKKNSGKKKVKTRDGNTGM
jgi:hypothetical protein